jgi:murein L,D-transpeptidase YcbB/YkuD
MLPLALIGLGGLTAYGVYEKRKNPSWTPFSTLFATPRELAARLFHVRQTSVPTPSPAAALDPGMTPQQVHAANLVLTAETHPVVLHQHAKAARSAGFPNTASAIKAKAEAVGEAKAAGASDADIKREQAAATAVPVVEPMGSAEAATLLNVLAARLGKTNVMGVEMPLDASDVDPDELAHCVAIFQEESGLQSTGDIDEATAAALRAHAAAGQTAVGFDPEWVRREHEIRERERRRADRDRHQGWWP